MTGRPRRNNFKLSPNTEAVIAVSNLHKACATICFSFIGYRPGFTQHIIAEARPIVRYASSCFRLDETCFLVMGIMDPSQSPQVNQETMAINPEDCESWRGISDPQKRRRLQNKINQRARRQRNRAQDGQEPRSLIVKQWRFNDAASNRKVVAKKVTKSILPETASTESNVSDTPQIRRAPIDSIWSPGKRQLGSRREASREILAEIQAYWEKLRVKGELRYPSRYYSHKRIADGSATTDHNTLTDTQRALMPKLPADNLLSLIYFNVLRALTMNISILGLDEVQICGDDVYPSPFLPLSPTASSAITRLPEALQPTELQKTVDHHAYIDIVPCPVLRDNALKQGWNDDDECELCLDSIGLAIDEDGDDGGRTGVAVWGDPWLVQSWEVSEYLVKKYPSLFRGCYELERATNLRREDRGWKLLQFA